MQFASHKSLSLADKAMATGIKQKNMVLLWENPNPSTAFVAQSVAISASEYKKVLIKVRFGTSTGLFENAYEQKICDVGETTALVVLNAPNASNTTLTPTMACRNANISTSSITFGAGMTKALNAQGGAAQDNTACIPYAIYGIKA